MMLTNRSDLRDWACGVAILQQVMTDTRNADTGIGLCPKKQACLVVDNGHKCTKDFIKIQRT